MRLVRHCVALCAVLGVIGATESATALAAAVPAVTATSISVVEGQPFSGSVGTISPCPSTGPNGDVTITWGDGSLPAEATLSEIGGTGDCSVAPLDPHTYLVAGSYDTEISDDYAAGVPPATGSSTALVSDAPISLSQGKLTGSAGVPVSGPLVDLDDSGGLLPAADYTVSISWGDGTPGSGGTVNQSGEVVGSHTFAVAGTYSVRVTVVDEGGQHAQSTAEADISPGSPPSCTTTPGPRPAFTPSATAPDARWLQAAFNDLLGRAPGPAELTLFTSALGAGATRDELAQNIEDSVEGVDHLTSSLFSQYLHRAPTAAELNFYRQELSSGTVENVSAQVLGSPEYLTDRGGGTVPGFLGALYCDTLDRSIAPNELNFWEQQMAAGTTRAQVAESVLASPEYSHDLVDQLFLRFLRRMPSPAEEQFFLQELSTGLTDQELTAALVGSQEYFNEFSGSGVAITQATLTDAGVLHVTLTRPATLDLVVLEVQPPAQVHADRSPGSRRPVRPKPTIPRTRKVGVVKLGHHHAGRITIHWNRRVHGHPLKAGHYLLLLQSHVGHRLTDVSEPISIRIRRHHGR